MFILSTSAEIILGADANNWDPPGLDVTNVLLVDCDGGSRSVTGFLEKTRGRTIAVFAYNGDLTFRNENASSDARNRFKITSDYTISDGRGVMIYYDSSVWMWRIIGSSAAAAAPGSSNSCRATLDFGTFSTTASVVVTGQGWVASGSEIVAMIVGTTAEHGDPIEAALEQIQLTVGDYVNGVGFTVYAHAPNGTTGTYTVHCIGV